MNTPSRSYRTTTLVLLLLVIPFALYFPAFDGEFVVDDARFIVNNPHLDQLDSPGAYFSNPATNSDRGDGDIYRPLRTLSFALDRALFGLKPLGYHLHNILLHSLVAVLAFFLLRKTLHGSEGTALLAVLLFECHPLAAESVAWISGRSDLQAAFVILLSLVLARRAEDDRVLLWCLVPLSLLAGLAKETAVMLPVLYLLEHRFRTGHWMRGAFPALSCLLVGTLVYLAVYLSVTGRGITGQVEYYGGNFLAHPMYGLVGIAKLLRLSVFPDPLNFMWETNQFADISAVDVMAAGLGILCLFGLGIATRRTAPCVLMGALWWFVALLPASNLLLPLRTVLAERFAYLPLIGLALAAACLGRLFWQRFGGNRTILATACSMIILSLLSFLTASRAAAWATAEDLYSNTLADFPESYAGHFGLGGVLQERGESEMIAGRPADETLGRAETHFESAFEIAKHDTVRQLDAAFGIGRTRILRGDYRGAVQVLTPFARLLEDSEIMRTNAQHSAELRFQLALALSRLLLLSEAEQELKSLMDQEGRTARRMDALGEIARVRRDPDAMALFEKALQLDPEYHLARIHLAEAMSEHPSFRTEARRQLREVLHRDPSNARAKDLLEQLGGN